MSSSYALRVSSHAQLKSHAELKLELQRQSSRQLKKQPQVCALPSH